MFFPTSELKVFFETLPDVKFLDVDKYKNLVGKSREQQLISFLTELGVKGEIDIEVVSFDPVLSDRNDLPCPRSSQSLKWKEGIIPGCKEAILRITSNKDKEMSILLWKILLNLTSQYGLLSRKLKGTCEYYYRKKKYIENFPSSDELCLKQNAWLINNHGEFVTPENVTKTSFAKEYDLSSGGALDLISFLGISDDDSNLTDSQRKKIELFNKLEAVGINGSNIEEIVRYWKTKRQQDRDLAFVHFRDQEQTDNH